MNLQSENESEASWRLRSFINQASDGEFELFLESPPADAPWQMGAYLALDFALHRREAEAMGVAGRVFEALSTPLGLQALREARGPDRRENLAWREALDWAGKQSQGPHGGAARGFLLACVAPREGEGLGLLAEACEALIGACRGSWVEGRRALAGALRRLEPAEAKEAMGAFWRYGMACAQNPGWMRAMSRAGAPMPATAALSGMINAARPALAGAGPMAERARAGGMERLMGELIQMGAVNDETVARAMALNEGNLPLDAKATLEGLWMKAATEAAEGRAAKAPAPRL